MKALMNKIARLLCLTVALATIPVNAQNLPIVESIDIGKDYGVSMMTDATLRELGYDYTKVQTEFPYYVQWCGKEGWSQNEVIDQYKITAALIQANWVNDTYMRWGPYMDRQGRISQSRTPIKMPSGTYRMAGTASVSMGIYSGQGSHVAGQATPDQNAPAGTSPGTMFVIDHARWNTARFPQKILMKTSSYGWDQGTAPGISYAEGTIIENIRFQGGRDHTALDPSYYSAGLAVGDLGECSTIRNCFAHGFNGDGFVSYSGTPAFFLSCSAFNNARFGFATLCTSGLNTTTFVNCSADDNRGGKYGNRAAPGGVAGGTYTIVGDKSESRKGGQIIGDFEGQVNVTYTGGTVDVDGNQGPTLGELFRIRSNGKAWQIDVRGLQHSFSVGGLVRNMETGAILSTPGPWQAMSFVVNNSGVFNATRPGIAWNTGTAPPTGSWTCTTWSACTNGTQTRTCTCSGTCADPKPAESQACTVSPPTGTMTATAFASTAANPASNAVDGSAATFWMSGQSMASGQTFTVDYGVSASRSSVSFDIANGYLNSYPRTFDVQVSTNGTTWTTAKAGATGAYPTCTATFTARTYRYVRVTCKTANSNWWAIQAWR